MQKMMDRIIPAGRFADFLRRNQSAVLARPDPLKDEIQLDMVAYGNFVRAVHETQRILAPYLTKAKDWVRSPLALLDAHTRCATNIPFANLLNLFEWITLRTCEYIQMMRANGGKHLVCIGIPGLRTFKSNLWFTAYCWHKVPQLAACVDYIVGNVHDAVDLRIALKADSMHILYFDDAIFSGGQLQTFMQGVYKDSSLFVIPMVPFMMQAVKEKMTSHGSEFATALKFVTQPYFIVSPADMILYQRHLERQDNAKSIQELEFRLQRDMRIMYDDKAKPPQEYYDEAEIELCLEKIRKVIPIPDNEVTLEVKRALLVYWRLYNLRPLFAIEHKLSDSVSICSDVVKLSIKAELVDKYDMAPDSLILYGGKPFNERVFTGTRAFYKAVKWYYGDEKTPISLLSELLTSSLPLTLPFPSSSMQQKLTHCWQCGRNETTMWQCNGCSKAIYCSDKCQTEHWNKRHHLQCQKQSQERIAGNGGSTNSDFVTKFFNGHEILLGRGNDGAVYTHPDFANLAVKELLTEKACQEGLQEFTVTKDIESSLEGHYFGLYSLIHMDRPIATVDNRCLIVMDRIQRPMDETRKVLKSDESIQFYLGKESFYERLPGRGQYIGRQQFLTLFQQKYKINSLLPLCINLGRFIGAVHFHAQYDGFDIEYVVGHLNNDPQNLHIIALDFSQCEKIRDWGYGEDSGITECAWSLIGEPYYPRRDPEDAEEDKYYKAFKYGYLEMAKEKNMEVVAQEILTEAERLFASDSNNGDILYKHTIH